jgi:hypothetical protein
MKLSEYNLKQISSTDDSGMRFIRIMNYTEFITQPFTLSMFIPCKEVNGKLVVLKEPVRYDDFLTYGNRMEFNNYKFNRCYEYKEALENVIFKGFELYFKNDLYWIGIKDKPFVIYISDCGKEFKKVKNFNTIEDIIQYVEFTDKVKKQFNLE